MSNGSNLRRLHNVKNHTVVSVVSYKLVTRRSSAAISPPEKFIVLPPSSRRQATLPRSVALNGSNLRRLHNVKNHTVVSVVFYELVTRRRFELRTHCLKGSCSTY